MPIMDVYHDLFKKSLIDNGWTITHDPYPLNIGLRTILVDLGAQKLIAAEKGNKKIAIEIKSFSSPSLLNELEKSIGQMRLYNFSLSKRDPERKLFIAFPLRIFKEINLDPELKEFFDLERLNQIIFNQDTGVIVEWLEI